MRGLFLLIVLMIIIPADLILLRGRTALWQRLLLAALALGTPFALGIYLDSLPQFSNNSPDATQAMRVLGLFLTALGGLVPWALAILHLRRGR